VNLAFHYVSLVLMVIQGIVLTPVYLRYVDPSLYGAWLATGNVIAWLSLIDPGISKLLIQRIAFLEGSGRVLELPDSMRTGLVLGWGLSAASLISWPLSRHVAALLPLASWQRVELADAVLLMLVATSILFLGSQPSGILLGLQKTGTVGMINTTGAVFAIFTSLVLITSGAGLSSIPAGFLVRNVVVFLGTTAALEHARSGRGLSPGRWSQAEGRRYMGLSALNYVERIAATVVTQVDSFLGAKAVSPAAAAQLGLTGKPIEPVRMLAERFAAALGPGMANLAGEGNSAKLREISHRILSASAFSLAVGLGGIVALNGPFVSLWVGPELFGGQRLTMLLVLSATVSVLTSSLAEITFALGAIAQATLARVIEGIVKLTLQIWLASRWGLEGIVAGGILAQAATTAWYYPVLLARRGHVPASLELRALVRRLGQTGVLLASGWAFHLVWTQLIPAWSWISFTLAAFVTSLPLLAIGLLAFPEIRREVLPFLRSVFARRAFPDHA
jgi:O-antigen/teichoic acid export membrane protein